MQEYEIRVLTSYASVSLIMKTVHFTDLEAIRAGRQMARERLFEVWRDSECIHGAADDQPLPIRFSRSA
jgi:hypothetical protein